MNRRKFIKGAASAALGVAAASHLSKQSEPVIGVDLGTDEGLFVGATGTWRDGSFVDATGTWRDGVFTSWEENTSEYAEYEDLELAKREWEDRGRPVATWFLDNEGEIEERVTTYRGWKRRRDCKTE